MSRRFPRRGAWEIKRGGSSARRGTQRDGRPGRPRCVARRPRGIRQPASLAALLGQLFPVIIAGTHAVSGCDQMLLQVEGTELHHPLCLMRRTGGQGCCYRFFATAMRKVVPLSLPGSAQTLPLWRSAISLTMASPRPAPSTARALSSL